jgi:hypothetical protein
MIIDNFVKIPSAALHFIATTKSTKEHEEKNKKPVCLL